MAHTSKKSDRSTATRFPKAVLKRHYFYVRNTVSEHHIGEKAYLLRVYEVNAKTQET